MCRRLLWCDIETTGLNENVDRMLELGLILMDGHLTILAELGLVVGWTNVRGLTMSDYVREMHEGDGLFDAVEASRLSLRDVEEQALAWVRQHDAAGLYMAGSGVHFDRRWLRHLMPALVDTWHYRNFDMTTLRYFFGEEKRDPAHRAVPDLRQNIDDLRRYYARARESGLLALPVQAA